MFYWHISDFHTINSLHVREISMCESSEWSGYYAHILSHDGANNGSFTNAIGCYCKIIKYPGTELEIRSISFKATSHTSSTCTEYVEVKQEGGIAKANICRPQQISWRLGCNQQTSIDLTYLTHDSSVGVNYKIAIQGTLLTPYHSTIIYLT